MESPQSHPTGRSTTRGTGHVGTSPTDQAVKSFQAGRDRDASFRILVDYYRRPLERFFARKGVTTDECLDLTQETFLGIYRGLEGFRGESQLTSWVFRIAMTTFLKRARAARTAKRSGDEVNEDALEGSPEALATPENQFDSVVSSQRRTALKSAVAGLPPKMRRCLILRIYREMTYREIAELTQASIDTVKAHLFQARARLRKTLGSEFDTSLSFETEAPER